MTTTSDNINRMHGLPLVVPAGVWRTHRCERCLRLHFGIAVDGVAWPCNSYACAGIVPPPILEPLE